MSYKKELLTGRWLIVCPSESAPDSYRGGEGGLIADYKLMIIDYYRSRRLPSATYGISLLDTNFIVCALKIHSK